MSIEFPRALEFEGFIGSKEYRCAFYYDPETCPCNSCFEHRKMKKNQAELEAISKHNFAVYPNCMTALKKEPEAPKESIKDKINRQRSERIAESEKTWAYVQDNSDRYAAHRADLLSRIRIKYIDFLGRKPKKDLICHINKPDGASHEKGMFINGSDLYNANKADCSLTAQVKHVTDVNGDIKKYLDELKQVLKQILVNVKKEADIVQNEYNDKPWFEKPFVDGYYSLKGFAKGFGSFVTGIWSLVTLIEDVREKMILHPIDESTKIYHNVKNGITSLYWLMHDEKTWPVLMKFAEDLYAIYDSHPVYADEKAFEFLEVWPPLLF